MSRFTKTLADAFLTLKKCPKLFLPKLLIAFFYSLPMLALPGLTLDVLADPVPDPEIAVALIGWLGFILIVALVDIFINALYPVMVRQFYSKGRVSFVPAFGEAKNKFLVVLPSVLAVESLGFIAAFLLALPLAFFTVAGDAFLQGISVLAMLAVFFAMVVLFFMLYPVATLEQRGIIGTIKRTLSLSRKNFWDVAKASSVSFGISLVSFALAFGIKLAGTANPAGGIVIFLLFVLVRFLTAVLSAYQYVLNPVFYMQYARGKSLQTNQ